MHNRHQKPPVGSIPQKQTKSNALTTLKRWGLTNAPNVTSVFVTGVFLCFHHRGFSIATNIIGKNLREVKIETGS